MQAARPRGVTLVELVIAISIVSIAAVSILGALSVTSTRSADAMVEQQALAIAQAYLDEIQQRWVTDPNGTPANSGRASWDLVDQYNGLNDVGARDQFGNAIASLADYTVSVAVSSSSALSGVPAASTRRVDVTVTHAPSVRVLLTGYRTAY